MSVFYTEQTKAHLEDVNHELNRPNEKQSTRNYKELIKSGQMSKKYEKLYSTNTSKFLASEENREHLVKSVMPMVIKIAKERAGMSNHKIEFDDALQAGYLGTLIAVDKYIANAGNNTAKFSTYAHSYILKYVREYCMGNSTILSANLSTHYSAMKVIVKSGDEKVAHDSSNSATLFDSLQGCSTMDFSAMDKARINVEYEKLFADLTTEERDILLMSYGVGVKEKMSSAEIAKAMDRSIGTVNRYMKRAMKKCKKNSENVNKFNIFLN